MRALVQVAVLSACGRIGFDSAALEGTDAPGDGAQAAAWTRLVAGDQTTCGIYKERAYCWGSGTNNEVGDGAGVDRLVPTQVALPDGTVTDVTQGEGHGCAIVDQAAYCWGSAPPGNNLPASNLPVPANLPSPVTAIAAGGGFTCAIATGEVFCWGSDSAERLGNGPAGSTMQPMVVGGLPRPAVEIDGGNDHAIVLLDDGTVWAWGHNDSGALGIGSMTPADLSTPTLTVITGRLPSLAGWHACVLESAGGVACWGLGTMGELGDGQSQSSATPVAVQNLTNVSAVVTGGGPTDFDATCAIQADETWCWGNGRFGRLGDNTTDNAPVPVRVQGLPATTVELALGYSHTCARTSDAAVYCWGRGELGQLGDGRGGDDMVPVRVVDP